MLLAAQGQILAPFRIVEEQPNPVGKNLIRIGR
jgi:hypothetical protein